MDFKLASSEAVVHPVVGPAIVLRGEDELGRSVVVCVVGPQPSLEVAWSPAVSLPRDAQMLEDALASLNTALAARYFVARTQPTRWCGKVAVRGKPEEPALLRSWRHTCAEPGRCRTELLFAHPEFVAWARDKLADPLGFPRTGAGPSRPWIDPELLARLQGRPELEARKPAPGSASEWAIPTVGGASYHASLLRRLGAKPGDMLRVSRVERGVHAYTTETREFAVSETMLSLVPAARKGAPPSRLPAAPAPPAVPEEAWAARNGLSRVAIRLHAGRGWAAGTPDALKLLERQAGWKFASVDFDGKRVKGAYADKAEAAGKAVSVFKTWKKDN
jgi:hypothetical protein